MNRVALVTGGARGIGAAIALGLAADGVDVAITYRRSEDLAQRLIREMQLAGVRGLAVPGSVEVLADNEAVVSRVVDELGGLDILVHNAGVVSKGLPVSETVEEEVIRLLRVHAAGPHQLTRLALPHLRAAPRGDIVFMSSAITRRYAPNSAPYGMAKAAMEALALTLAQEERRNNVHVNVVAPGMVDTEMGQRAAKARGFVSLDDMVGDIGFGGICSPTDVASVVRFLVSDGSRFISGERLYVDGGLN